MGGDGRSAIRMLAIAVSTLVGLGLLFGLLFIQVRATGLEHTRQLNYGELERVQHQLRDWVDVVRQRVGRNGAPAKPDGTLPDRLGPVNSPFAIEEVLPKDAGRSAGRPEVLPNGRPDERESVSDWCNRLAEKKSVASESLSLAFDGSQRRDDRVVLSYGPTPTACSRVNVTPILGSGVSKFTPNDMAIADADGRVLLVLRGDADWPEALRQVVETVDAESAAAHSPGRALVEPVAVRVGGERWDLYAVPLDMGRPIRVGGIDDCAARQCLLLALGRPAGLGDSLRGLSPLTRTTFVGLALLVLLLIPLLKLKTIDRNGALHWVDVVALVASVPLTIAVMLMLLVAQGHWLFERARADDEAQAQAQLLATALNTETKAGLSQAWAYGQCLVPKKVLSKCPARSTSQTLPLVSLNRRNLEKGTITEDSRDSPDDRFSDFDSPAKVDNRDYYRRIRTEQGLLDLDFGSGHADFKDWRYTVAQVPAINEGKSLQVVALRPPSADPRFTGTFLLGAKPLASTLVRPLPPGFGFAVIDPATLEVLQHSDRSQEHSQHFDEQISRAASLRLLAERMPSDCGARGGTGPQLAPAEVLYRGENVRMAFSTACAPRWIVAAWYSKAHEQHNVTIAIRFAGAFMAFVAGLTALLALAAGISVRRRGRERLIATIWPRPEAMTGIEDRTSERNREINRNLQAGLPWLCGFVFLTVAVFAGDAAFLLAMAIPVLTALAFARGYYRPTEPDGDHRADKRKMARLRRRVYFGVLGLLLIAVAVSAAVLSQWVLLLALIGGATVAWFVREIGKWSRKLWRKRRRTDRTTRKSSRTVVDIADKTATVRRIQLWAVVLLALLGPIAAYRAGFDTLATANLHEWRKQVRHDRAAASNELKQLTQRYVSAAEPVSPSVGDPARRSLLFGTSGAACIDETNCVPEGSPLLRLGQPSVGPSGGFAELSTYWRFWPETRAPGCVSTDTCLPARIAPTATVAGLLRPLTALDEFADRGAGEAATIPPKWNAAISLPLYPARLSLELPLVMAILALIGLAGFVLFVLHTINHGLFGLHHFEFRSLHPPLPAKELARSLRACNIRRILFIDFRWQDYEDLCDDLNRSGGFEFLHLGQLRDDMATRPNETLARKPWVVRGFESIIGSGDLRRKALLLMERLTAQQESEVYFFSEMLPLDRLKHQREREKEEKREAGEQARGFESEAFRWAELFEGFVTFRHEDQHSEHEPIAGSLPAKDQAGKDRELLVKKWVEETGKEGRIILKELAAIPSSRVMRQRITFARPASPDPASAQSNPNHPVREQIYEYLANFLADYYQSQWVRSSKEEHLVMVHLAQGRFVNADNFAVLNNLLTRGLVRREPEFRLMNRSFEHWIRTLEHPRWFERYRDQVERGGAWHTLRVPVIMLAVTAAFGAAYLDQGMSGSLLTMVPAIAAAVPLLIGRITQTRKELAL